MQCQKCQLENREGANFCNNCGRSLQSDLKLPDDRSEVDNYSLPPTEEKPPRHAPTIVSERKHVTVLFSDLTGYTEMSLRR
jgi:class 3 adenylate cyclase